MASEPISSRFVIPWVSPESVYQETGVPEGYSAVRECRASNLARESALQSTDLVLEILRLLTESASR